MSGLTLGSIFDGSGAVPWAGMKHGITPVFASKITPFPIRVTTKRIPQMQHVGDITKLKGSELPPVDIVAMGSPRQDISISSSKKSGLHGERSSLFFEAIRVIREMREATDGKLRWIIWENVQNALYSQSGADFREVLECFVQLKDPEATVPMPEGGRWLPAGEILGDDYSVAWRVLDPQAGWGIPQRRKRCFVVVDLDG